MLPFARFPGADSLLGPEMRSTGEVLGLDARFGAAFAKSQEAAYGALPAKGVAFLSVRNADKRAIVLPAKRLADLGFTLVATTGTAGVLRRNGVEATIVRKGHEGPDNVVDRIRAGEIDLVVNTPAGPGASEDGYDIRIAAVAADIPCITTLSGLTAVVQGIEARLAGDLAVRPLQAWHGADEPVRELCEVLERRRVGGYQALTLAAPQIAETARPGQFVHLLAGEDRSFPLRRPFSHPPGRAARGPGHRRGSCSTSSGPGPGPWPGCGPTTWSTRSARWAGPFDPPEAPAGCLLVGGGYGTAPLFFLATELRARRCRVDFVIGAATAGRLLDAMEAERLGHSLTVTTDDGSAGRRGLVTDPLPELLAGTGAERVYACGPMPMLAAVSRVAAAAGVACQVAVEEQMACGTGICFSCVLPVGPGTPTRMARSCLEGPVFDGAAIAWAELGYPELEPAG